MLTLWSAGWLAAMAATAATSVNPATWQPGTQWSLKLGPTAGADLGAESTTGPTTGAPAMTDAQGSLPWPRLLDLAETRAAANRAANAGAQAAAALSDQAHATAWLPQVDTSATASRTRLDTRLDGQGSDHNTQPSSEVRVSATQPLWRAADRATSRARQAQADRANWQARQARLSTAQQLSQAYLQAAEAAEQKRLLQAQQALLEAQLQINERRLQAGAGTILDVLETRTRLDQTRASVQDSETRRQSLALQIRKLCGQDVSLPLGLHSAMAHLPEIIPAPDEAMSLLLARNPQRRDAMAQTDSAAATLAARQAERWQPTVDATASWARDRQRDPADPDNTLHTRGTTVGVQVSWPLFTSGYQDGRTREAVALQTQAQAQLDDVNNEVSSRLRDDYQILSQARKAIQVQQEVETSATAAFEAVRKAFVAGMRTNLDLLNAQQQIYAARQNLVGARIQALSAQVGILAALDQLDSQHIAPLAAVIDDR